MLEYNSGVIIRKIGKMPVHFTPNEEELSELVPRFDRWKATLVTDPEIMGGEAVFPNSRLSVRRIGGMIERGESRENIREDYPYLSEEDLKFSSLYVKTYPAVGRSETHEVFDR